MLLTGPSAPVETVAQLHHAGPKIPPRFSADGYKATKRPCSVFFCAAEGRTTGVAWCCKAERDCCKRYIPTHCPHLPCFFTPSISAQR